MSSIRTYWRQVRMKQTNNRYKISSWLIRLLKKRKKLLRRKKFCRNLLKKRVIERKVKIVLFLKEKKVKTVLCLREKKVKIVLLPRERKVKKRFLKEKEVKK